MLNRAIIIHNQ